MCACYFFEVFADAYNIILKTIISWFLILFWSWPPVLRLLMFCNSYKACFHSNWPENPDDLGSSLMSSQPLPIKPIYNFICMYTFIINSLSIYWIYQVICDNNFENGNEYMHSRSHSKSLVRQTKECIHDCWASLYQSEYCFSAFILASVFELCMCYSSSSIGSLFSFQESQHYSDICSDFLSWPCS